MIVTGQDGKEWGSQDLDLGPDGPRRDAPPINALNGDAKPESFQAYFPSALMDQLRIRALTDRTTVKALVLRALHDTGYLVPEEALQDRRRKGRPRGA